MAKKGSSSKPEVAREERKVIASNRRARHNYDILETVEAGIVLRGAEVKSLRDAQIQLKDGYARPERGELLLLGVHIAPYSYANGFGSFEPERPRKGVRQHFRGERRERRESARHHFRRAGNGARHSGRAGNGARHWQSGSEARHW